MNHNKFRFIIYLMIRSLLYSSRAIFPSFHLFRFIIAAPLPPFYMCTIPPLLCFWYLFIYSTFMKHQTPPPLVPVWCHKFCDASSICSPLHYSPFVHHSLIMSMLHVIIISYIISKSIIPIPPTLADSIILWFEYQQPQMSTFCGCVD
jgi:hypothetical protein